MLNCSSALIASAKASLQRIGAFWPSVTDTRPVPIQLPPTDRRPSIALGRPCRPQAGNSTVIDVTPRALD